MGTAHLKPHGTRSRYTQIVDYRKQHISILDRPEDEWRETENDDFIVNRLCQKYGFKKPTGGYDWIHNGVGVEEKVIAETSHGVELRIKYHPDGAKYYFMVVTSGEFNEENLALQHLDTYNQYLRELLEDLYGEVRQSNGRWTSTKVTV